MRHQCVTCQTASDRPHQCHGCAGRDATASRRQDLVDATVDAAVLAFGIAIATFALVVLG